MEGMTGQEVVRLIKQYIGVTDGHLGDFSFSTLRDFYPEFCDLSFDVRQSQGTKRDQYESILRTSTPDAQAKIIRGTLKRYPAGSSEKRTQDLHDEFLKVAERLESGSGVTVSSSSFTSEFVRRTLDEVENAVKTQRATSGVDRVHSALHGYLRHICDEAQIGYVQDDKIIDLFKKLLAQHTQLMKLGPRPQDTATITRAFCGIMNVIDPLRNRTSFAHPTDSLLDVPEAMLVINAVRTIMHYLEAKLS